MRGRQVDEREQPANERGPLALPAWIVEYNEMMRYPQLWDAVQTSWYQDDDEHTTLMQQLIDHTNYILVNQFREQLGLTREGPDDGPWQAGRASVNRSAVLEVDDRTVPALEIDTDPFIYAIGAQIERNVVTTVVVDREHLPHIRLALRTWNPELA